MSEEELGLLAEECHSELHTTEEIEKLCFAYAKDFKAPTGVDALCFLMALSGVESSFGINNIARHEPAFGPGGLYYQKSSVLKAQFQRFGSLISASYGPFQMLYATALNLGYPASHSPLELWDGHVSMPYVVAYLNAQVKRGADTIVKLADAYNSGSFKDKIVPDAYIKKFTTIYLEMLKKYKRN